MAGSYWISIFLLTFSASVLAQLNPDERIFCYPTDDCTGTQSPTVLTRRECCDNLNDITGYSTQGDSEGCRRCPIVFGFAPTAFIGAERGEDHTVQAGYLSGRPDGGGPAINLNLTLGTATANDVSLTTTRIRLFPNLLLEQVAFAFRVDSVAQELNETFEIVFVNIPVTNAALFPEPPDLSSATLAGAIIDADRISFGFSEGDFREFEGTALGALNVIIARPADITIAKPVIFRVTPLTIQQALDQRLINTTDLPYVENTVVETFSPPRADGNDFSTTPLVVTFPVGGASDERVSIPITNDTIDEAEQQFFIAYLQLVNATSPGMIDLERVVTTCIIVDIDPIHIGFALETYTYFEPDRELLFMNVTLIREGNRLSEQTFAVGITVADPASGVAATLQTADSGINYDYRLGGLPGVQFRSIFFPASAPNITFNFLINRDTVPEGTESFRALSSVDQNTENIPAFMTPVDGLAFVNTEIIILDNDIAVVGFEQLSYTISETGMEQEVCVQVFNQTDNEALGFTIFLAYETVPGTADGSDFGQDSGLISYLIVSPTRMCFRVSITNDDLYENVESFTVNLILDPFAEMQSGILIEPNVTTIYIEDADAVVIGFINVPYEELEDAGSIRVTFGVITGSLQQEVAVVLFFSDGIATNGSDYQNLGRESFNLTSVMPTFTFDLLLIDDEIFELAESLSATLNFFGALPPRVTLTPETAQLTILDNDEIMFGFNPVVFETREDSGMVPISVSLFSGNSGDISVTLLISTDDDNIEATATADSDFSSLTFSRLIYPSGSSGVTNQTIFIDILPDDLTELSEFFVVMITGFELRSSDGTALTPTDQESSRISITIPIATVFIFDSNEARIGFNPVAYSGSEDGGSVSFMFGVLEGNIAFSVNVLFSTSNGTAISGFDFDETIFEFAITGNNSISVTVAITNDEELELSEQFFGNLAAGSSDSFPNILFDPILASADILDDDEITVGFVPASYRIDEGQGEVNFVIEVISGVISANLEVEFYTESGSAQEPGDYLQTVVPLTFRPDTLTLQVSVPIVDDDSSEIDEVFYGNLRLPTGSPFSAITFSPERANATILDDDLAVIGFVENYDVTEGSDNTVSVEIQLLSGELERSVQVRVFTVDDSAQATGDYIASSQVFTFTSSRTQFIAVIDIVNDDILESSESFSVRAELVSTDDNLVSVNPAESIVTIEDDDMVVIGFRPNQYTIDENAGEVIFTIEVISGTLSFNVDLDFSTQSGNAIAPDDYSDTIIALQLGPETTSVQVSVPIVNDALLEYDEVFFGNLRFPLGSDPVPGVNIVPDNATATIRDDDNAVIGFERDYSVIEGINGTVEVGIRVLSGELGRSVVVRVFTASNTAQSPGDFIDDSQLFTFSPTETSFPITLTIVNDIILEASEDFFVRAELVSTDATGVSITPDRSTVTIADEDMAVIGFTADYEVTEGVNDSVSVVIRLISGELGRPVDVIVFTVNDAAQASEDYTEASQVFTFTSNMTQFTTIIPILDDVMLERPESFSLRAELLLPTDAASVAVVPDTSVVTILDNDMVVIGFLPDQYSVNEGDGMVMFTVAVISGTLSFDVTLDFSTESGSALDSEDFVDTNSVLEFGPDTTSLQVSVQILDDDLLEADEVFFGNLVGSAVEGVEIEPDTASATITDNDNIADCIITEPLMVNPFNMVNQYSFMGICELTALMSCNGTELGFAVRVDFLTATEANGAVGVYMGDLKWISREDGMFASDVQAAPSGNPNVMEYPDNDISVTLNQTARTTVIEVRGAIQVTVLHVYGDDGSISISVGTGSSLGESCGICGTQSGQLLSLNGDIATNPTEREAFVKSYRVPVADQSLRPIRTECAVMGNDTMIADPLFTCPMFSENPAFKGFSMCYEVHGRSHADFNLISDTHVSINGRFSPVGALNIISSIAIRAEDYKGVCMNIKVDLEGCTLYVGMKEDEMKQVNTFSLNGIAARRKSASRVRISVPNGDSVPLVMWVICEAMNQIDMIRFHITRGLNLRPTSHGLIGQFWGIDVCIEAIKSEDLKFNVTVKPPDSDPRSFCGDLYSRTWDNSKVRCLYVGNGQGGPSGEKAFPGSVIEGHYEDYIVESAFSTSYNYSKIEGACAN